MVIEKEVDLFKYSTMRTHSVGSVVYTPQNRSELINLICQLKAKGENYHLLAAGSNVVFADKVKTPIVNLMSLDNTIRVGNDGNVTCGASVRIQKLINAMMDAGLGGIEYLYSLPASVGGIVYMNAGRGKNLHQSISDFLKEVEVYIPSENRIELLSIDRRQFSHRYSPYQDTDYIILSASFVFPSQEKEETLIKIKERMEHSRKYLSADKPSCGSVFCKGNRILFRLMKGMHEGDAIFSKKTPNWISNLGNASGSDVIRLIQRAKKMHKMFFFDYIVEINIFE